MHGIQLGLVYFPTAEKVTACSMSKPFQPTGTYLSSLSISPFPANAIVPMVVDPSILRHVPLDKPNPVSMSSRQRPSMSRAYNSRTFMTNREVRVNKGTLLPISSTARSHPPGVAPSKPSMFRRFPRKVTKKYKIPSLTRRLIYLFICHLCVI